MQFNIIHKDSQVNARYLPKYSLQVNIREGWQMISDIGHAVGITWETQNKEYNRYHPNTWRFWKNKKVFMNFIGKYQACLFEYDKRFENSKMYETYFKKYAQFIQEGVYSNILSAMQDYTDEQNTVLYLLNRKTKNMTEDEIKALKSLYKNIK